MKPELSKGDKILINNIKAQFNEEINLMVEEYRPFKVKIKQAPKKTTEDEVIDMFIDDSSLDSISQILKIPYHKAEEILIYNGLL